jgi:NTE family protein
MNADWGALVDLRDRGRQCADAWLSENYQDIGRRSTVDVRDRYL